MVSCMEVGDGAFWGCESVIWSGTCIGWGVLGWDSAMVSVSVSTVLSASGIAERARLAGKMSTKLTVCEWELWSFCESGSSMGMSGSLVEDADWAWSWIMRKWWSAWSDINGRWSCSWFWLLPERWWRAVCSSVEDDVPLVSPRSETTPACSLPSTSSSSSPLFILSKSWATSLDVTSAFFSPWSLAVKPARSSRLLAARLRLDLTECVSCFGGCRKPGWFISSCFFLGDWA